MPNPNRSALQFIPIGDDIQGRPMYVLVEDSKRRRPHRPPPGVPVTDGSLANMIIKSFCNTFNQREKNDAIACGLGVCFIICCVLLIVACTQAWASASGTGMGLFKTCNGDSCEELSMSQLKECANSDLLPRENQILCQDLMVARVMFPLSISFTGLTTLILFWSVCATAKPGSNVLGSTWKWIDSTLAMLSMICCIVAFSKAKHGFDPFYSLGMDRDAGFGCGATAVGLSILLWIAVSFELCCRRSAIENPHENNEERAQKPQSDSDNVEMSIHVDQSLTVSPIHATMHSASSMQYDYQDPHHTIRNSDPSTATLSAHQPMHTLSPNTFAQNTYS